MRFKNCRKSIVCAAYLITSAATVAIAAEEGRVVTVVGQVTVNGIPAKAGDVVPAGGTIETGKGATASLIFGNENVVKVTSNSVVGVEPSKSGSAVLNLTKGNVDGVKKMGTTDKASVVVKTDAAVFELTGGRYSVSNNDGTQEARCVAVDRPATVTYLAGSDQKPSDTIKLNAGSYIQIPKSLNDQVLAIPPKIQEISTADLTALRPSMQNQPTNTEMAQQLVTAITSSTSSSASLPQRGVASVDNTTSAPSLSEVGPSANAGVVSTTPSLPRDPMQTVPGRPSKAAVTIIFEPIQ